MRLRELQALKTIPFNTKDYRCLFGVPQIVKGIDNNVECWIDRDNKIPRYIPHIGDFVTGIVTDVYGITNSRSVCRVTDVCIPNNQSEDMVVEFLRYIDEEDSMNEGVHYPVYSLFFRLLTEDERRKIDVF